MEFYNSGDQAVDLGGLSFAGFDLTFGAGTVTTRAVWNCVTLDCDRRNDVGSDTDRRIHLGRYVRRWRTDPTDGGRRRDSHRRSRLLGSTPWSALPDGNGPSLELRDWALDNSLLANWSASITDPTPAAENSIFGNRRSDPITDIVVAPGVVLPNQEFSISANINDATEATLVYKACLAKNKPSP